MLKWLSKNKFQTHLIAFALMVLSSVGMIFALQSPSNVFVWVMIGIFAAANLLSIFIK